PRPTPTHFPASPRSPAGKEARARPGRGPRDPSRKEVQSQPRPSRTGPPRRLLGIFMARDTSAPVSTNYFKRMMDIKE
ncbi:hypothetical protein LEMLEM_LOCUS1762, partial [Lemmus lemmus]